MNSVDDMDIEADRHSMTLVGVPLEAWAFAGRTWIALVLALYVAFWLQLESPASAALSVASLSFPARGQGMEKAFFRVLATIVGLTACIAITGLFSQTEWLLLTVIAAWIGLCVYASSLFDGFRTYAAVLCIITVCLIAVEHLDTPYDVFNVGLQRGAAIVIGILSVALINAAFSAPDYYPAIGTRLERLRRDINSQARESACTSAGSRDAQLLQEIAAQRPEITSLATESTPGRNRSQAARTAMVDLVFELSASRAAAALKTVATRPSLAGYDNLATRALEWMTSETQRRDHDVISSIVALRQGVAPKHVWRAPFYRSHRIAVANGVRAFVYFGLAALVMVSAGWPSTSVSLAFVGILIGLSAMSSDQAAASLLALVAVPVGCVLAGVLEFVVLNGATAFPLLALALLPFVTIPALIMTIPNPAWVSFGRSNLVFTVAVFSPANPQTYNPESYLFACIFLSVAAVLLFVCHQFVPPFSRADRLRVLSFEARRDLATIGTRQQRREPRQEAMFRDAVRIGQMVSLAGEGAANHPLVNQALACFDRASAIRLAHTALDMLATATPDQLRTMADAAVSSEDPPTMLAAANEIAVHNQLGGDAVSALAAAAFLLETSRNAGEPAS